MNWNLIMASKCLLLLILATAAQGFSMLDFEPRDPPANPSLFEESDPCYDAKLKRPKNCVPDFVNAAYGLNVEASSTCGLSKSSSYCTSKEDCQPCDTKANGPQFLTDLHNPNNVTCWKSDFINRQVVLLLFEYFFRYSGVYTSRNYSFSPIVSNFVLFLIL